MTYVLIPGAGGDPWYWHRIIPLLESGGHEVVSVSIPAGDDSAGWTDSADAIVQAVGSRSDLILVAQSLAGFSAPIACERLAVDCLILVNAMVPLPGETGGEWWANTGLEAQQRTYLIASGLSPADVDDDAAIYFHDVPPEVMVEAFRRGQPNQSMTPMAQPWPLTAWPDVNTRVVVGREDRLFPAAFQHRVANERLGIEADELPGGHLIALSQPHALAEYLQLALVR